MKNALFFCLICLLSACSSAHQQLEKEKIKAHYLESFSAENHVFPASGAHPAWWMMEQMVREKSVSFWTLLRKWKTNHGERSLHGLIRDLTADAGTAALLIAPINGDLRSPADDRFIEGEVMKNTHSTKHLLKILGTPASQDRLTAYRRGELVW